MAEEADHCAVLAAHDDAAFKNQVYNNGRMDIGSGVND